MIGSIKHWNNTVKLTGLAYSREVYNIFALSCREPNMSRKYDIKFHDHAWDK